MKLGLTVGAALALVFVIGLASFAAAPPPSKIARGKYLVDGIARCGDCHTPHNQKGEEIASQNLRGAPLVFKPTVPMPMFADKAPNIAGLPGWEDDAAVKFLMTGIAYNEMPARPPMPQYRLNREDAEAVVEYLKSLAPAGK